MEVKMVKDEIYRILASDPSYMKSYSEATEAGVEAVLEHMRGLRRFFQWDYSYTSHPDEEGATITIFWVDDGELDHVSLTYRNI
jgi:hypothetical protein